MPIHLSIVVPLFNEEECVEKLVHRIVEVGKTFDFEYEIILVDDGSTDDTWKIIEHLQTTVKESRGIKLRRNFGQTVAMVAGFDHSNGNIIVTLDGDLQNDPADIPMILRKLDEGFDIVSGWRKNRKDNFARVLPSMIANYIISKTTGVRLHDYGCSLKAYRTDCIKSIKAYGEMHRFFPALASMTGARVTEVVVNHHPRKYGISKYGFDRIYKVFLDILSMNLIIRFSSKPLTGFVLSAIPFAAISSGFCLLGFLALSLDWTPGKAIFFFFAMGLSTAAVFHLILLGILGELAVGMSDLDHTQMPEVTKRSIEVGQNDK